MMKLKDYLNEEKSEDVTAKLIELFSSDTKVTDKMVHDLAEELGEDPDSFEEYIYEMIQAFWSAGRAKESGFTAADADEKELSMGIKIEMEHTTDKAMSRRIALDHLSELPDYYTRLAKMEKEGEKED